MISKTITQQKIPLVRKIYLKAQDNDQKEIKQQQTKLQKPIRNIKWAQDVIDNQNMGKRRSNVCCIYHKRHGSSSSSSDTCTSDDQTNRMQRQPIDKKKHKLVCSKYKKCNH